MKVAIATDHMGVELKNQIKEYLSKKGYEMEDFGTNTSDRMDYPDTVVHAARSVSEGKNTRGIVICGSGLGASYTANKVHNIRAALCTSDYHAQYSRLHNDANIIVFGSQVSNFEEIKNWLDIWFITPYEGGRHQSRLDKIHQIEIEESERIVKKKH